MKTFNPKIRPSPTVDVRGAYVTPIAATPVDLYLNANEGVVPPKELLDAVQKAGIESVRRYPDDTELRQQLSELTGVQPDRLIVTAGADDALERVLRAVLAPGREMIMPVPTFEMIGRYAQLIGCSPIEIPWLEPQLPVDKILSRINSNTALIAVVTPNSPMGFVAELRDLKRISEAAPESLLLVDLAYTDFADKDLTQAVLELPNAVVTRTLSKAWGLAGLRVGWAAGPEEVIGWLGATGHPYSVSAPSLAIAGERLRSGKKDMLQFVGRVKEERGELYKLLTSLGVLSTESQGNFVLARFDSAKSSELVRDGLAGLGIAVRIFPHKPYLEDAMRISVPGEAEAFKRLLHGLETVLDPEALIFDIDDTLADVTDSYRGATVATAASFGVEIDFAHISRAKAAGDANNDWVLTYKIVTDNGVETTLEEVTKRFEEIYQGTPEKPGLKANEKLLAPRQMFERLSQRFELAVVTGRPRSDATYFLEINDLTEFFGAVVTMDDGPLKPSPVPMQLAMKQLGVSRAWMIGDTPDDIQSARKASVLPIGVIAPADDPDLARDALISSGAARVLIKPTEIEELLS
jgi:histidinol-phosphate aminotransferase